MQYLAEYVAVAKLQGREKIQQNKAPPFCSGYADWWPLLAWSKQKEKAWQIIPEYPAFKYAVALRTQKQVR